MNHNVHWIRVTFSGRVLEFIGVVAKVLHHLLECHALPWIQTRLSRIYLNEVRSGTHDGETLEVRLENIVFRTDPWKDRERQFARRSRTVYPALDASKGCSLTSVATLGVCFQDRRVLVNLLVYSTSSNAVHLTLCIET